MSTLDASLAISSNVHKASCLAMYFSSASFLSPWSAIIYGGLLTTTLNLSLPKSFEASFISPFTISILSSSLLRKTLSLAAALQETGAGEVIANKVIGALGANPSPYILTLVVFLLCCIMTNFMSNTATTALMVPICLSIAQGMGADPRAVLMACVIGGSCAYATPIGMPANTMVVGAGGYKFMDYVKAGFPLILIATVVSMIILPIAFPFFP